jgi:NADH-quinone oxidoreductase subunit E
MSQLLEAENGVLDEIFAAYPSGERRWLIPILQDIQDRFGYLPEWAVCRVSDRLRVPTSKIFGVATFYNQFRLTAPGKHVIRVCRGTACHVKGSAMLLEKLIHELNIQPGQTTRDGMFSIETVACIGACSIAPVIAVDNEFHGRVEPMAIPNILAQYRTREEVQ